MYNIIIVSPYSPKWSNIASVRWEKLSKYLSQKHKVTLVTSSFNEVFNGRSFDVGTANLVEIPLKFYRENPFSNSKDKPKNDFFRTSFGHKIKGGIRVIFERIFPISSGGMLYHDFNSYKREIEKLLLENEINVLITTYDPWFSIKLGSLVKKKCKDLIWIADFRDPSFNIHESIISRAHIFRSTTRNSLKLADIVTVVTNQMKEEYEKLVPGRVMFLPNGFDGEVCLEENNSISKRKNSLTISYTGSLHPKTIEISYFVEALKQATTLSPDVSFVFNYAGFNSSRVKKEFYEKGIGNVVIDHDLVERDRALDLQRRSDILLLIAYTGDNKEEGKAIRTGKVYEYLASGKPIIVIAPNGWEMKDEIECDGISKVFDKSQTLEMAKYLVELSLRESLKIDAEARRKVIERYMYRNLAAKLEEAIMGIVKQRKM